MSDSEGTSEEQLDHLLLDIKAFVLLQGSESSLKTKVQERLVNSHDEQVRQFVKSTQYDRNRGFAEQVLVGLGELVLASILVVAGTIALIPTMVGIETPQQLLSYFSTALIRPLINSPFSQYVSAIEFVIGAFLLLAAFYTLRQASVSLRDVGLSVNPSDE